MKYRMFSALMVIFLLIASPMALAPSHPDFTDAEGEVISIELIEPGVTPDSLLHPVELWWEDLQEQYADDPEELAALLLEHSSERFAEMSQMVEEQDYVEAAEASAEVDEALEELETAAEQLPATEENLDLLHDYEEAALVHEEYAEEIQAHVEEDLAAGLVSADAAEELRLEELHEETVEMQVTVDDKEEDLIDVIAVEQGVTHIEAELQVEDHEEEVGLDDLHAEEVTEEFAEVDTTIQELEASLELAVAAGEITNPLPVYDVIEECKKQLQEAEHAAETGDYSHAYSELTDAEYLAQSAEAVLEGESLLEEDELAGQAITAPEQLAVVSLDQLEQLADQEEAEREQRYEEFTQEYEEHTAELQAAYPEHTTEFEENHEQYKKAMELAKKVEETYSKDFTQLLAEGKSEYEVTKVLTERFAAEYEHLYGEKLYMPPGFHEEREAIKPAEGLIEGHIYTDPVTGYKYELTADGYMYTTPEGLTYEEKYPEGYKPEKAFEEGNEEHTYTAETTEGTVTYKYFATGYEVTKPDGSKETFSYPEGEHRVHGGGEIDIEPHGFEYNYLGDVVRYEYNPEFDTYTSTMGESYRPPEGTTIHDYTHYEEGEKMYEYISEHETWSYDPATGVWTSSTGETYEPTTTAVAPVGHEGEESFSTETGESWTFDSSTGKWTSSSGEEYHEESGEYHAESGGEYTYDQATGTYTTASGESLSYDASSNTWTSSSGETHAGETHSDPGSYSGGDSGSYSGDGGSYSGGDAGGSYGGDGGGYGGGGDGGGHGGGDGGGGH